MLRTEHATLELAARLPVDPRGAAHTMPREDELRALLALGPVYIIMDGDEALAIAGASVRGDSACVYATVAASAAHRMVGIDRVFRRLLEAAPFRRMEAIVSASDRGGIRWARLLGFTREGRSRAWAPDGGDVERFAWIRESAVPAVGPIH